MSDELEAAPEPFDTQPRARCVDEQGNEFECLLSGPHVKVFDLSGNVKNFERADFDKLFKLA